ncbi:MAG: DUF4440 domain-containing protein [Sphingomonadaceae bacterium]
MAAMTRFSQGVGVLLLAAAGALAHAADTAQDLKTMHSVEQNWLVAYNAGDVAGVVGLYADEAVLMPPNQPAITGKAALRSYYVKELAAAKKGGAVISIAPNPAGATNGDMGWEAGSYLVHDPAGRVIEAGKYLSVFRKLQGQWRYVRDTWNSDGALTAAK